MIILYVALILILAVILVPMVVVGIGMFFKKPIKEVEFTIHKEPEPKVTMYDLPNWLKWFQNPEDGLIGDIRGWYWNTYFPVWVPAWFKMWYWSAVRNTYNYFKRIVIGIDIREYTFHKLVGDDYVRDDLENEGFQILYAKPVKGGIPKPMLYWVKRWGKSKRGICLQIGWKIKLSHNHETYDKDIDYYKGCTLEPNFFKDLS